MKTEEEIRDATRAAEMVVEIHHRLTQWLRAGQTLADIDNFVARQLTSLGVVSAFRHYQPAHYPKFPSFACLSVNNVIVHGTAGMSLEPIKPGDVVSIDLGVVYHGWNGDAAWTYIIEDGSDEARRLCECGVAALTRGVQQLQPGFPLRRWAQTVQECVEKEYGYYCVQGLGGHQIGLGLHTGLHLEPHVANSIPAFSSDWPEADFVLTPGLLLAVEPIIAAGTRKATQKPRQWPIYTADGSLSVHYEHDVLITDQGPRVLTAGLESLPIVLNNS